MDKKKYMREYMRKYYKRPEVIIKRKKFYEENKERLLKYNRLKGREYNRLKKLKVMNGYGGKCDCCGEDNIEFLAIDHINGGGNKHIKEMNFRGRQFYNWLIKNNFPSGFRVLCFNCNWSLGNYGYCPHQKT